MASVMGTLEEEGSRKRKALRCRGREQVCPELAGGAQGRWECRRGWAGAGQGWGCRVGARMGVCRGVDGAGRGWGCRWGRVGVGQRWVWEQRGQGGGKGGGV